MTTYFVTGATGVVGSALVPALLADPAVRLTLLVRAGSAAELAARFERLFGYWRVPADDQATRSRVEAVAGDTTLPRFGLDDATYRAACAACTHIVHAAGLVRMNLPLHEARRAAVDSARNAIELARACPGLRKLDFVSTVGIGGRLTVPVPEQWLAEPRGFHNTYEQAKAEAEDLLREQSARDPLPLTVHRPSMVVGDSRDGRIIGFQVFYFLCEFLSGRRTFGLYPDFGDARLDIVGCDIVADAIAAASRDPQTVGSIFNLCSGPQGALRIDDVKHAVRRAFRERGIDVPGDRVLPRRWYSRLARFAALLAPAAQRRALATLPIYLDYLADSQSFENSAFRDWLGRRGRSLPEPAVYLPKVLDFYLATRPEGTPGP